MRPPIHEYFMSMAFLVARRSTCLRRQVGCILVDQRNHVLATGYNGVAAGLPHCNEQTPVPGGTANSDINLAKVALKAYHPDGWVAYLHACPGAQARSGTDLDLCGAIHAEQNALLQCSDVYRIKTCYVTASPCMTCMKLLLNTSCTQIVYAQEYSADALTFWNNKRTSYHLPV